MTEENDKLKRLLNTIQIPEPDEEARKGALKAAMAEFQQLKKAEEKKSQRILMAQASNG